MAKVGEMNQLSIVRESDHGLVLDGEELGEILLPTAEVPMGIMPSSILDVFIHFDSKDRLVASSKIPYVRVGKFAYLEVIDVDRKMGAFLDWGLTKDLLLPFREQTNRVRVGQGVVVTVFVDPKSGRLVASERLNRHLSKDRPTYEPNDQVHLMVIDETDLGYNVIVDQKFRGLIYHNELSEGLDYGSEMKGYVSKIREDGKLDVRRDLSGFKKCRTIAERIMHDLESTGGFLPLHDKSDPADIREQFDVSKKAFKLAISSLYGSRKIVIEDDGIRLVEDGENKG